MKNKQNYWMNAYHPVVFQVHFAESHFGYICNVSNINNFMQHYDCVTKLEANVPDRCQQFISSSVEQKNHQVSLLLARATKSQFFAHNGELGRFFLFFFL